MRKVKMSEKKTPKIYMSFRNNQKAIEVPNGLRTVIRKCIAETLRVTDFVGDADVSVTLVDNERIKRINKEFRDKNKVTDVISFPLGAYDEYDVNPENGAYMLGDIVISMEKAHAQAIEYGHSLVREVGFLATHSTLHLLGYDNEDEFFVLCGSCDEEKNVPSTIGNNWRWRTLESDFTAQSAASLTGKDFSPFADCRPPALRKKGA